MLINSFKLIIACKIELSDEMNTNESRNFFTLLLLSKFSMLAQKKYGKKISLEP